MTWVFIVLILAGMAMMVRILTEYQHEANNLKDDIQRTQINQVDTKQKVEETERIRDEAAKQVEELGKTVNQLQTAADELLDRISAHRREQAKRGKYRV